MATMEEIRRVWGLAVPEDKREERLKEFDAWLDSLIDESIAATTEAILALLNGEVESVEVVRHDESEA